MAPPLRWRFGARPSGKEEELETKRLEPLAEAKVA
jgi:hypothetical protein